jgi:hypothetical protein
MIDGHSFFSSKLGFFREGGHSESIEVFFHILQCYEKILFMDAIYRVREFFMADDEVILSQNTEMLRNGGLRDWVTFTKFFDSGRAMLIKCE